VELLLDDITVTYRRAGVPTPAVRGVSVGVRGGRTLAMVGESGSGKTTLAKVAAGLQAATSGSVAWRTAPDAEPEVVTSLRAHTRSRHVQMVFQHPVQSLNPRWSMRRSVQEPLRRAGVGRARADEVAAELIAQVGLDPDLLDRRPRDVSGGQAQRVAIARAMACRPRVVVLDEPTASLDRSVRGRILALLADPGRHRGGLPADHPRHLQRPQARHRRGGAAARAGGGTRTGYRRARAPVPPLHPAPHRGPVPDPRRRSGPRPGARGSGLPGGSESLRPARPGTAPADRRPLRGVHRRLMTATATVMAATATTTTEGATDTTVIDLIALRRQLHRQPELGLHLPDTRQTVLDALAPLGLRIEVGQSASWLVAVVPGARPGPTVLLRADMDALPVVECSGESFAATNGAMHACGHDLHTAALVGAVHRLHARRAQLRGDVLAVFQPGEEGAGGAELMIKEGVLGTTGSLPIASYGAHVLSFAPPGSYSCRSGAVMGATVNVDVQILGAGGHAARPHAARDPISTAALVVQAIQTYVAQNSSPAEPVVVTVGSLHAGTAANVIPDDAVLEISLRAASSAAVRHACRRIAEISTAIAGAYGQQVLVETRVDVGPTVSDEAGAALVRDTVIDLHGADAYVPLTHPEMISEDFSLFLERTGGAFVLVGAAVGDPPQALPANHSPQARFDDAIVPGLANVLVELAIRRLAAAHGV
jgi:hippurate hydrolase